MGERTCRSTCFPANQIWQVQAPPKIVFFAWEASRNCILTVDNLMSMVLVNRCCMRKSEDKSCNHLLLHCYAVYELRRSILRFCGVS